MFRIRPFTALAAALFVVIVGAYLLMAARFPMAYLAATYEDLFGEWLQFYFFAAAMIFSAALLFTPSRYRLFFALLAAACFYVTMEEISWGQRIFGWSSPAFFRAHNIQGETNLHNFLVGPVRTGAKSLIEYLLTAALLLYGVVYPALLHRENRAARWFDGKGLPAPPLCLWPFFAVAALLELGLFRFNEAEVAEILLGFAFTAMAVFYLSVARSDPAEEKGERPDLRQGGAAATLFAATMIVALLAGMTTLGLYSSPSARVRTEKRVANGIEKFAGRYARYEMWDHSLALYKRMDELEPGRPSLMRDIADVSRRSGDEEAFGEWTVRALEHDLHRLEENPVSEAANRSISRTYRLMGDDGRADEHLGKALDIGLERVRNSPDSARAAYSLARTYDLLGSTALALKEYRRAAGLEPSSRKYAKALYSAESQQDDSVE